MEKNRLSAFTLLSILLCCCNHNHNLYAQSWSTGSGQGIHRFFTNTAHDKIYTWGTYNVGVSTDTGKTFQPLVPHGVSSAVVSGDTIYVHYDYGCGGPMYLERSTDNGATWDLKINGLDTTVYSASYDFIIGDGVLYLGTAMGLFRSLNHGESWQHVYSVANSPFACVYSMCYADGIVFIAVGDRLAYSSDHGETWVEKLWPSAITQSLSPWAVGFNQGRLFLAANQGAYISDDYGTSWTLKKIPPAGNAIGFAFCNQQVFMSDYTYGAFTSPDNGNTWTAINDGLTVPAQNHFSNILLFGDKMFMSDNGPALYTRDFTCNYVSGIDEVAVQTIPVYPNPVTDILNLPVTDATNIIVYDIQGRTVIDLPVTHISAIDVSALNSGTYVIQFKSNGALMRSRFVK